MPDPTPSPTEARRLTIGVADIGQTITGYWAQIGCADCGLDELVHVAHGTTNGIDTQAIAACPDCGRQWQFTIRLSDVTTQLGTRPRHSDGCSCPPCRKDRQRQARQQRLDAA